MAQEGRLEEEEGKGTKTGRCKLDGGAAAIQDAAAAGGRGGPSKARGQARPMENLEGRPDATIRHHAEPTG
jgi:hypothetical protein